MIWQSISASVHLSGLIRNQNRFKSNQSNLLWQGATLSYLRERAMGKAAFQRCITACLFNQRSLLCWYWIPLIHLVTIRYFFFSLISVGGLDQCDFNLLSLQVEEKKMIGISAIKLTKMWLNEQTAIEIVKGKYSFIYLVSLAVLHTCCGVQLI